MNSLELKNIIKLNGREFLLSTINKQVRHYWFESDNKRIVYETMIFEIINQEVQYHKPVFNERYNLREEAIIEHSAILKNPEFFISKSD